MCRMICDFYTREISFKDDDFNDTAFAVRKKVFILEQGIDEEVELDSHDLSARHLILYSGGNVIGTLRILFLVGEEEMLVKIGRLAVLKEYRKSGAGTFIMERAHDRIRELCSVSRICLHAQVQVAPFYEKLGYESQGEPFMEDGLMHVQMVKEL